jgi:hypothetical protein
LNKEFDTTKSALFNVLDTWLESARFYADVQYVMALRMMRLALGGSDGSEKASAFAEAQVAIVTVFWRLEAAAMPLPQGAYAPCPRSVRAKCLRLAPSDLACACARRSVHASRSFAINALAAARVFIFQTCRKT